ncbi:MAG: hypothetical protein ACPG4N_01560, partial [Gammaproteobacteria bacterium]
PLGDELEQGADRVLAMQPLLAAIESGAEERGGGLDGVVFVEALSKALDASDLGPPVGLIPAMDAMAHALQEGARADVSWVAMISGKAPREVGKVALYLAYRGDASAAVSQARQLAMHAHQEFGAKIALAGDAVLSQEESRLQWVNRYFSLVVLLLGVLLIGLLSVHDLRLAGMLTLVFLVWGLMQGLWLESPDIVSAGSWIGILFAAVLLGIVVFDVFDRHREAISASRNGREAATMALVERVGGFVFAFIIVLLALPVFSVFAYGDLADFARSASMASATAFVVALFALPPALILLGGSDERRGTSAMRLLWAGIAGLSFSFSTSVKVLAAVLVLAGLATAPLFNPALTVSERLGGSNEVRAHQSMIDLGIGSPWNIVGQVPDERTASNLAKRLSANPEVKEVIWAGALASEVGTRERGVLTELGVMMGTEFNSGYSLLRMSRSQFDSRAWSQLRTALLSSQTAWSASEVMVTQAAALIEAMTAFEDRHDGKPDERDRAWASLEQRLLVEYPIFWRELQREITEPPPSRRDASSALAGSWVGNRGGYRMEVVPAFEPDDVSARGEFSRFVQTNLPSAAGGLLEEYERRETLVTMMVKSIGAAFVMALLLSLFFAPHRVAGVGVVLFGVTGMLLPAGMAAVNGWTIDAGWVAAFPALGLLLIATGTMTLHRIVRYQPAMGNLLLSSTGRAVIIAWTAVLIVGLGLWVSAHPAVSGMGAVALLASVLGVFLSLVVIASLFAPDYSVSER